MHSLKAPPIVNAGNSAGNCQDRAKPMQWTGRLWRRHQEKFAKPPLMERTGWSRMRLPGAFVLLDHPGCTDSEASQHCINGAATPPHEEGIIAPTTFVSIT